MRGSLALLAGVVVSPGTNSSAKDNIKRLEFYII